MTRLSVPGAPRHPARFNAPKTSAPLHHGISREAAPACECMPVHVSTRERDGASPEATESSSSGVKFFEARPPGRGGHQRGSAPAFFHLSARKFMRSGRNRVGARATLSHAARAGLS